MKRISGLAFAMIASAYAIPAAADVAVNDCPLRDAPFSIDMPLLDVLRNDQAKAAFSAAMPEGGLSLLPPMMQATEPPTITAILSPRIMASFGTFDQAGLAALDKELRAIPLTDADRAARCTRYDDERLQVVLPSDSVRVLLFEKVNGFRDDPSLSAAHVAFVDMANRNGWTLVTSDKGGAFHADTLRQFDLVVWNNISGDVLTMAQRKAFEDYMANGGGFIGLHGTAGDFIYFWDWYVDKLLGARFLSHTAEPQFQTATVRLNPGHPMAAGLPAEWRLSDEWYSFATNPRSAGAKVLATLDEDSYHPVGHGGQDLRMGDHPIAWTKCVGKGRMFYSAIGHLPAAYSDPNYVRMLENAVRWVADTGRHSCDPGK